MRGKKNLEKAIVLGLMLSSIAVPVWAEGFEWGYNEGEIADSSGTGISIENKGDVEYPSVDVLLTDVNPKAQTTCALIIKHGTNFAMNNTDGDFSVVNNIENDITLEQVQKIQNITYSDIANNEDGIIIGGLQYANEVLKVFNNIKTFENNALFASGGSNIDINANNVKIVATGGFTGLNSAISAENTNNVDDSFVDNNKIIIRGNKVEIIGDIDTTKGDKDNTNVLNSINVTLNSSDSYWYGSERRDENWQNSQLNITLANGAEWVYDNNVLLGKSQDEIFNLIKDILVHESITNNGTLNALIDKQLKDRLGFLEQISSNEGSEISAITLEGGKVILQDEYIKQKYGIYESDIIDILAGNKHQKVTIGELKGNGGIFKVDLDWATNKGNKFETENSDYIYIEKMSDDANGKSTQIIDFDASKAHLDQMKIGEDRLYFANVAEGETDFVTVNGTKQAVSSGASNIYNYGYEVAKDGDDFYLGVTGKSAEGNANFESAKGAMYAGYALGTELDTLNKRMGEARYLGDDNGVWVRYRHVKTGWNDTFETNSNMFQLGFDNEVQEDDGTHYRGVAVDYTDADTSLMHVSGDGENKRYAVSLYDTWIGEKGHYRDLVLRGGRINSDYDISGMFSNGMEDIGGDYHQWFGSISAEWGRKNDMQSGWYFEPQTQLQLARVGGASYVSDSGIAVDQDGATSLIGRVGFRLGREYEKDNGKTDHCFKHGNRALYR